MDDGIVALGGKEELLKSTMLLFLALSAVRMRLS